MGKEFDNIVNRVMKGAGVKLPVEVPIKKVSIPVKTKVPTVVQESVKPTNMTPATRPKITIVKKYDPNQELVTEESIKGLGFVIADKENFLGASDQTYVLDQITESGRVTLLYDFCPPGNQGNPAAHLYFSATDVPIVEKLVCFSATSTLGELKELVNIMENIVPKESRTMHDLTNISQLITEAKKSTL